MCSDVLCLQPSEDGRRTAAAMCSSLHGLCLTLILNEPHRVVEARKEPLDVKRSTSRAGPPVESKISLAVMLKMAGGMSFRR